MSDSLYSRLGGYDGIAAFTTGLLGYATKDELLGRFWEHGGEDHLARERQLLIDFLVDATGGDMYYRGRDVALTHRGMRISEADWSRFIEIVTTVAGELGVGPTEGAEVMAFLDSQKSDVVTV